VRIIYWALALCAGVLLQAQIQLPVAIAGPVLIASGLWVVASPGHRRTLAVSLMCLAIGMLRMEAAPATGTVAQWNDAGGMTLTGTVQGFPEQRENQQQFTLAVSSVYANGRTSEANGAVLVRAARDIQLNPGDQISVTGRLSSPNATDRYRYTETLARAGVSGIVTESSLTVLARGTDWLMTSLASVRVQIMQSVREALPEPASGLLIGILLGDDSGIAYPVQRDFAITGSSHVLAVSGFNLIVVSSSVLFVLRRLSLNRTFSAVSALLVIIAYVILTGATPSVLRAGVMSALIIVGSVIHRRTFLPASLAAAAFVLVLLNPTVLWDIGFQFSLFTTLAIAQFAGPLDGWMRDRLNSLFGPRGEALSSLITVPASTSLAAQIAVVPLTALYFGTISLIAPLVSTLIVPLQPPIFLIGAAAVLLYPLVPTFANGLLAINQIPLHLTVSIVRLFAQFPFAQQTVEVSRHLVATYYLIWIGWSMMDAARPQWFVKFFEVLAARPARTAAILTAFVTLILLGATALARPDGSLHIWFLDQEGQSAVLIQSPEGAQLLVDGGNLPVRLLTQMGDHLPFGDDTLDVVVATQPDAENTGALMDVLSRYQTGVLVTNGQQNLDETWLNLMALAERTHPMQAGASVQLGDGVQVEVLWPKSPPTLAERLNDATLVLRVTYGEVSVLLAGDLSQTVQDSLAEDVPLASTVLHVTQPWRSDAVTADFWRAVQPSLTIISERADSQRDNPDPALLQMLSERPVLNTAGGTIHLWTDGITLWSEQIPT